MLTCSMTGSNLLFWHGRWRCGGRMATGSLYCMTL